MRIVQCHGCFDLLHLGHIRHLQAAKAAGDYLVVTVTPDRFVNKGPGRPVFSERQRAEAITALACVDKVLITNHPTAREAILDIKPAVFAKGPDYSAENLDPGEAQSLKDVGAELLITKTEKWSSTALLTRETHSPEIDAYLQTLRFSATDVLGWLEKARTLKTLVIGDAITDEYVYVESLGKSGKEPMPAVRYLREDTFRGGVHAVAEHVKAVCDVVTLVTGPPTIKTRFIETYPFQKLFEIYESHADQDAELTWPAGMPTDVIVAEQVIVADYGHGFVSPALVTDLCKEASCLAVNAQANAGNHGFNTISKYPNADFVSLSERELRLDARDQTLPIRDLMTRYPAYRRMLITRGQQGCLAYDDGFAEAPGLISHTVDRMGAGDAVFAITACCAAVGMPLDMLTFVAAVVGTMAVGIVGNARYIERDALHQAILTWLR